VYLFGIVSGKMADFIFVLIAVLEIIGGHKLNVECTGWTTFHV
jgi:hypothetical protein